MSTEFMFHYNLTRTSGTLHEDRQTVLIISRLNLLRMRNVSPKSNSGNQKTHFMFNIPPPPKTVPFMRQCGKKYRIIVPDRPQVTMAHAQCMLNNYGHKHALRICNTYCFPTVTMVTRTRLDITLHVHSLSCSIFQYVKAKKSSFSPPPRVIWHQHPR